MPKRYSNINFTPPKAAVAEAKRALAWVSKHGRGGTSVGRTTARLLASGNAMPPARVRRMARYFPRHEVDKRAEGYRPGEKGYPSNGRIAWALWGGDSGWSWSRKVVGQMDRADEAAKGLSMYSKKSVQVEIKADENRREITAYASTFGNVDNGDDVAVRGCFAKTLQEDSNRVKVLWEHSRFHPIGLPMHMEEDSKGLLTVSKISNTTLGNDIMQLAREGVLDRMSIGYKTRSYSYGEPEDDEAKPGHYGDHDEEDEEEKGSGADLEQKLVVGRQSKKIRYLTDVKLYEYSLVSFPMNDAADVVGVKSWANSVGLTDNEEFLSLMRKCNIDIFDSPEVETYTKDDLIEEIASIVLEKLDSKNNNRDPQSAISDFQSIINGINNFTNKVRTKE